MSHPKYVHKPDRHEAEGDELFCIFHDERLCGAECVAFDVHGAQDDKRTSCILVNARMQQASSLVSIAKSLKAQSDTIPGINLKPPGV